MTTVITVASSKGGVGKTTIATHLAVGLALRGHRTLLIDLDPTASATAVLVGQQPAGSAGAAEALLGDGPPRVLEVPGRAGLAVLPATRRLDEADTALAAQVGADHAVMRLLERARGLDYVAIDTPPALGRRTLAALVAADGVIVPVPATTWALDGLVRVQEQLAAIARCRLGSPRLLGCVLFAADARVAATAEARQALGQRAPGQLYRAEIRVSAAAATIPGQRLTAYDPGADPRGAEDHAAVLAETLARLSSASPPPRRARR